MAIKRDGDKVMMSVILTKTQKRQLEEQAEKLGIGLSALIRLAVSEWLDTRTSD